MSIYHCLYTISYLCWYLCFNQSEIQVKGVFYHQLQGGGHANLIAGALFLTIDRLLVAIGLADVRVGLAVLAANRIVVFGADAAGDAPGVAAGEITFGSVDDRRDVHRR